MFNRLLNEVAKIQVLNAGAAITAAKYPTSTNFIDVSKYERFAILVAIGTLDSEMTLKLQQATAANGTPKDIAGTTVVVADDADNKWAIIEVQTDHLDINNGYKFITVDVAGTVGETGDFIDLIFLGFGDKMPVTQTSQLGAVAVVG